jgi:hypothetical protein
LVLLGTGTQQFHTVHPFSFIGNGNSVNA